jgi:hypothetical protein
LDHVVNLAFRKLQVFCDLVYCENGIVGEIHSTLSLSAWVFTTSLGACFEFCLGVGHTSACTSAGPLCVHHPG